MSSSLRSQGSPAARPSSVPRALLADARGTATTEFLILFVCICVVSLLGWQFMGEVIVRIISGD